MADGEILINTKIQTDEAKKDLKDLKNDLEETAESASKSTDEIKKTAEDLSEPYKKAYEKIEQLRSDDETDQKTKAAQIAGVFKGLGQSNSDAMKKAWEIVKDESDEGSQKIIDNLEKIANEAKETGKSMSGIGSGFGGGGSGGILAGIMGGISGALTQKALDLLKEAGKALVEFGKESIELGSDLQEVQNVVDVTFGTMSDQVNEFARDAIESVGMSETIAKKYVGTFGAMAKSFGFTEAEAFDMSTALTQLTGDVASFYNLDHDEAYTKLKSVFTGETEALKDLGVVMTQSALDQYAMEKGIKKTTSQMSEQEKTALRYSFVVDKLSGASGDFVRTQDSWANQTRILALQWESFQATIGKALIEVFTPALQFLTGEVMPALQEFADWLTGGGESADELTGSLDELGTAMEETITKTDGTVVSQEELNAAIESTSASVEKLKQEYDAAKDEARESLNSQIGLFDVLAEQSEMSSREIVDNWKAQQEALSRYANNMKKAINMGLDKELVRQLSDGSEQSILALNELVNNSQVSVWEINSAFRGLDQAKDTASSMMADVETDFSYKLEQMAREAEDEWGDMADIVAHSIYEMQSYINKLQGKTVYIDIKERRSTTSSYTGTTYNPLGRSGGYSTEPTSYVPYLAEGAVIPPNAPFTAVLGDQRNGYNLEGPEDMFRGIVRDENNEVVEATTEIGNILMDILLTIQNLEIDGRTIFDLYNEVARDRNTARGRL